jgi:signal transduction histidine kinase
MAELVAHIAHEVNQPLAAMAANANACTRWLAAQPPNIGEAQAACERIVRDAGRAAEVIAEMRAFLSRTAARREVFMLQAVIDEAVARARPLAHRAQVTLRADHGETSPARILGRRNSLRQALTHLLENAVEACGATTPREVRLRLHGPHRGEMVVEVEDTGPGFPPEFSERMFEPLFSTKPGRLGMGLAVSRSVIEEQGGRLLAQRDGERTRFIATLPLEDGGA